jgi:HEAT repeat protein
MVMRPWTAALSLLVALWCGSALGQEATPSEKKFLTALTAGLSDESPEVRRAAAEALVLMGHEAAVHLVGEMGRLGPDARDRAVDVLVRIGQASLDEIDRLKKLPSGAAGEALNRVRSALDAKGGIAGFGDVDPAVRENVRKIVREMPENSFYSDDSRLKRIEALGRPAIPVLLDYLNPANSDYPGMRQSIATEVLARLCTADDVPRLCRLLDLGWLKVSRVLARIGDRSCTAALIRAMQKGQMSWDLANAIQTLDDPRTDEPIVRFLEQHGTGFPYGTRTLLDIVADRRIAKALPALRKMRTTTQRDWGNVVGNEVALGRALALLGDSSGIPLLIRHLDPRESERWSADRAGKALNAISGQAIWSATADRGETKAAYQEWWDANQARLEWDPTMRRYRVKG